MRQEAARLARLEAPRSVAAYGVNQHARKPKNPGQLKDSVWAAMYEDYRFVKVGRGI